MSQSIVLNVSGMKCGGCESNVSQKLQALDGVSAVSASSQENVVSVEFDPAKTNLEKITEVITEAGFSVE